MTYLATSDIRMNVIAENNHHINNMPSVFRKAALIILKLTLLDIKSNRASVDVMSVPLTHLFFFFSQTVLL